MVTFNCSLTQILICHQTTKWCNYIIAWTSLYVVWHALCPWFAERRTERKQKLLLFYYYKSNHFKITVIFFITNQQLHDSGCNGPSTGSTQLYKTVDLHFLHVAELPKTPQCVIYMSKTELCTENRTWSSMVIWVSQVYSRLSCVLKTGIGASRSTTYILHTEEFSTALIHAENVRQLHYTTVCSLIMDQYGPKHVEAGVLYYCNFKNCKHLLVGIVIIEL